MRTRQQILDQIAELEAELKERNVLPTFVQIPSRSYKMSKTPVTVAQWNTYCEETGEDELSDAPPNQPIVSISYHQACAYAKWLSNKLYGVPDRIRLPTEDEWEYCCADHKEASPDIAVYDQSFITDVATKAPNAFGLYDMLGLVYEWTSSPYFPSEDDG